MDPLGRFLYRVNTTTATVQLFTIDQTSGALTAGDSFSTLGTAPRSAAIDPMGRNLYVVHEGTSETVNFTINPDGSLTLRGSLVYGLTPTSVVTDPSGSKVFVAAYGGGAVTWLQRASGGQLIPRGTSSASQPRHLAMHPAGKFLFAAEAPNSGSPSVRTFSLSSSSAPQSVAERADVGIGGVAGMLVDPSGDYLYVLGYMQLETFSIAADGSLTPYGTPVPFGASSPPSFALSK